MFILPHIDAHTHTHTLRSLEAEKGCLGNEASDARRLPSGFASDPRAAAPEFGSFGGCTPPTGMFQMNRELPFADTR